MAPHESASNNQLLLVIIALILPPLAVFLKENGCSCQVWLNILLCFLFMLPGLIHALYILK